MNYGEILLKLRKKRGLSQKQASKELKISQSYLSLIENNEREPSISFLEEYSKLLRIPPELIFLSKYNFNFSHSKIKKTILRLVPKLDDLLAL